MKGVFTLGIYIAIGITGAAFGQQIPPKYSPIPPTMEKAFTTTNPLLEQLSRQSAAKTAEIARQVAIRRRPSSALPARGASPCNPRRAVVIKFGAGGRVDEHRQIFAGYRAQGQGGNPRPLLFGLHVGLGLCGAGQIVHCGGRLHGVPRHSIDGDGENGGERRMAYRSMPTPIQGWIDDNGGGKSSAQRLLDHARSRTVGDGLSEMPVR